MNEISAIQSVTSAASYKQYSVVQLRWQIGLLQQKIDAEFHAKEPDLEVQLSKVALWQKKIDGLQKQIGLLST